MSNQVEIDIERHVLTQTKKLSDETFEKIFSRNPRNESRMFTYNCHLCGVASLSGERALQTHITGKKHQQRLLYDYVPNAEQFRTPLAPKAKTVLFPGEPAPPGYEDEVNTVTFLEPVASKQLKPLIGLEYVVELFDNKAKEPFYVCTLCDKRCDPRNIIAQITSHRHRMKYLESHFSSVMKALNLNQKFNLDMKYREEVLSLIAEKIETKSSRMKPHTYDFREFERNKSRIVDDIKNQQHFSEKDWPECEKVLLENLKTLSVQEFESVSSESDDEFNDMRKPLFSSKSVVRKQSRSPSFKVTNSFVRVQPDSTSERRKILTPRELNEQSNAKMQEKYILEKYKASVEIAVKEEEKKFKEFEKNPEKHPLYSEEWKAFWSRRYKELIAQGKNASSYDYKPEWIEFWTNRMKELHKNNIERIKKDFRKKLGLSQEKVKKIEDSPSNSRSKKSQSQSPRRNRKRSESPIRISDDSDVDNDRYSEPKHKRHRSEHQRRSERSHSRFSEDSPYSRQSDYRSKEAYESSYYSSRARDYERSRKSKSPEIIDNGPVNVISVCRLLSALEGELGLLAKTVIDLLGKAVAIEKLKPNSADDLLLNAENCNVLETVKEKLKGVLTANLIAPIKVVAVKRAIQNIATLLHNVSKRKPTSSNVDFLPTLTSYDNGGFKEPNAVDNATDPETKAKLEIAKVITQTLYEQGRTNVSAEELEALVESFMAGTDEEETNEPEEKQETVENFNTKVEPKQSPISTVTSKPAKEAGSGLENLTDEDLQTLLRNFADLTSDEQSHLIAYLSKIEQTNPTRVEKLRKYVNIGDDPDYDDKRDDNLDMDLAAGVIDISSGSPRKKSPVPIKQDLSDDDYDDDDDNMKTSGMNRSVSHKIDTVDLKFNSPAGSGSALKDNLGLADSLMSSLMQSSMPAQNNSGWEMDMSGGVNMEMSNPYYQQPHMSQYPMMFDSQMNVPMNMGMQNPYDMQMHSNGSRSGASGFFRKAEIPKEFSQSRNAKKRFESSNNRHLAGSSRSRR